jgi:hypothetical protein
MMDLIPSLPPDGSTAEQMAAAAAAWLVTLSPEQRELAVRKAPKDPAAEDDRLSWFFTPTDHGGLMLHEQSAAQQGLAMQLVSSGLSLGGYVTASTVMGIENILDRIENWRIDWGRERGRDPQHYYLRIFGTPGEGAWAWRFGGHHISLNNLIVDGRLVSATPLFFGSDPAEIAFSGGTTLRPFGGEEDLGRALLRSLDDAQREKAVLLDRAPADVIAGNRTFIAEGDSLPRMDDVWRGRFAEPRLAEYIAMIHDRETGKSQYTPADYGALSLTRAPKGAAGRDLDAAQREMLLALVMSYVSRAPEEVIEAERQRYANPSALDEVHFAWAGGAERGEPHYYRVQGPRVLIEYDNTQRDGNHCHAVWRDPVSDFGLDVLYEHLDVFHSADSPPWPVPPADGRA